jgi:hypothetical protein
MRSELREHGDDGGDAHRRGTHGSDVPRH